MKSNQRVPHRGIIGSVAVLVMSSGNAWAQPAFIDITTDVGLDGYIASTGDGHGPGGVFADLNNDGYPELYLVRAPIGHDNGEQATNQLYLNVPDATGGRTYVLIPNSGAEDNGAATGAIAGDYDNDGDLDLYITNFDQPNVLLANQLTQTGVLSFIDVTATTDPTPGIEDDQFGVGNALFEGIVLDNSLTAAWADVDRDGDLDLYVGNHNGFFNTPVEGPFPVPGRRDVFYINNADGTFTEATMQFGVPGFITAAGEFQTRAQRFSSTNAVIFADFNNDAWPDLLVTNKIGGPSDRDMLYINQAMDVNGQWLGFANASYDIGFGTASGAAMGVDVADFDNDGDLDIYITDFSDPDVPLSPGHNDLWINLVVNTGQLRFGLARDTTPYYTAPAKFSWGAQWQDFTNNGLMDLHVATNLPFRDYFFLNTGMGYIEAAESASTAQVRNARGDMTADYNRDGWVDLFVVNLDGGPSVLYENNIAALPEFNTRFLTLKLQGDPSANSNLLSTRDAIGARVYVIADLNGDGQFEQYENMMREVLSGSSNATSTSSLELEFGLGQAQGAVVLVVWPSGTEHVFTVIGDTQTIVSESDPLCFIDLNADGMLNFFDISAFLTIYTTGDPAVDFNGDGELNFFDVSIFLIAFSDACP